MGFKLLVLVFASLLLVPSILCAQENSFNLLPSCAQECINTTITTPTCHITSSFDASCACYDTTLLSQAKSCFNTACNRKAALQALRFTSDTCNEKVRDKSVGYRNVTLAFYILALVSVSGQWAARIALGRLQWLDDGNTVAVLLSDTLLFAVCFKMSYTGLGQDMWNLMPENITITLLYFWISEIAYFTTLGFIKIAFLLFFLQIFPERQFRRIVWGIIYVNIASIVAFGFAAVFVCSPVNYAWLRWDGEHKGSCINNNTLAFSHAAHSILMDFVTLSLPVTQILNLQMSLKKKIGVLLMFSVGAFVTIISIVRLRSLVHFANTTDMTWDYLEASLWSVIECQVGIICVCMPSLRLGLSRLFPKLLGSSLQESTNDAYGAAGWSRRSHGNTLSNLSANKINVQTTFKVSHAIKAQPNDDERSFVQLVEIDTDSKSGTSK